MFRKYFLIPILLIFMVLSASASAEDRVAATESLILSLVERIQTVIEGEPSPQNVRTQTDMIIDEYFDFNLAARFAAGQAWRQATDDEKKAYKKAFREVLLSLAETQFEYFRHLEYTSKKIVPKGKNLIVAHGMIHDKTGELPDVNVAWRINTRKGKPPRIVDVEIENISMLITQQQENTAIIRQNGGDFSALIRALEKMNQDIKANKLAAQ